MNNHKKHFQALGVSIFVGLFITCLGSTGCNKPAGETTPAAKSLPKQYFHCPDEFEPSVKRLREIHDAVTSSNPLPEPITLKVVEIIHGEGAGAHSHYYPAGKVEDDGHHGDELTTDEKMHELEIDAFTELRDIAWVLPNVAADSDMQEKDWLAVKKAGWSIVDLIDDTVSNEQSMDEKRASYKEKADKFGELLSQLETISQADEPSKSDPKEN